MRVKIFLVVVFLSSCGYSPPHDLTSESIAIHVPYVIGDSQGQFTDKLIRALCVSGQFDVVEERLADFVLRASIVSNEQASIGYMRHREDTTGKVKKNLITTESRRTLGTEVTLLRGHSEEVVFGPYLVKSSTEYDYVDSDSIHDLTFINSQGKREKVITFSLGQLDSIEGAQDDALFPLYESLARKVVDGLLVDMQDFGS